MELQLYPQQSVRGVVESYMIVWNDRHHVLNSSLRSLLCYDRTMSGKTGKCSYLAITLTSCLASKRKPSTPAHTTSMVSLDRT